MDIVDLEMPPIEPSPAERAANDDTPLTRCA